MLLHLSFHLSVFFLLLFLGDNFILFFNNFCLTSFIIYFFLLFHFFLVLSKAWHTLISHFYILQLAIFSRQRWFSCINTPLYTCFIIIWDQSFLITIRTSGVGTVAILNSIFNAFVLFIIFFVKSVVLLFTAIIDTNTYQQCYNNRSNYNCVDFITHIFRIFQRFHIIIL